MISDDFPMVVQWFSIMFQWFSKVFRDFQRFSHDYQWFVNDCSMIFCFFNECSMIFNYLQWFCFQCIVNDFSMMCPWSSGISQRFQWFSMMFHRCFNNISKSFQESLQDAYGTLTGREAINRFNNLNIRAVKL